MSVYDAWFGFYGDFKKGALRLPYGKWVNTEGKAKGKAEISPKGEDEGSTEVEAEGSAESEPVVLDEVSSEGRAEGQAESNSKGEDQGSTESEDQGSAYNDSEVSTEGVWPKFVLIGFKMFFHSGDTMGTLNSSDDNVGF